MAFEGAYWLFSLRSRAWNVELRRVRCVEPSPAISIEHPMAPASRVSNLRFKSPSVNTPINHLRGTVLPGRHDHSDARTDDGLLLPLRKLIHRHGPASLQVHGEAETKIEQTRAIR